MNCAVRKSSFRFALVLGFFAGCGGVADSAPLLPVVPLPQEVEWRKGSFALEISGIAIKLAPEGAGEFDAPVNELRRVFEMISGGPPADEEAADRIIYLGLPERDPDFLKLCQERGLWPNPRIGAEGYVLLIVKDLILVAANEAAGLYYGVQTLKQLLRAHRGEGVLPAVRIADWPAFRYRGVMDDISRGPIPTMAFMKQQVRRLAEMKVNLLMYYTEHVVATRSHPDFAPPDAVSIEEWHELAQYAGRYHIQLAGNFQSLGHYEKILAHPNYQHLGERGRMLSPVLPESIDFLRDIYTEMAPVFTAPFFCVNGDEAFDLGKGASRAQVEKLGVGRVYAEHIMRLRDILKPLDTRMMIWGDMVLKHPEIMEVLPKDILIGTWHYGPLDSYAHLIEPFMQAGFEVLVTPGVLNSHRIMPDYRQTRDNILTFAAEGAEHNALGLLNTVWDDGGSALFSRDWYGVAFGADQSWNPSPSGDTSFDERFEAGVNGDPKMGLSRAIWHLANLIDLSPTDRMNEIVLWDAIVPEPGGILRLSLEDWDQVIEHCKAARQALDEADPLLNEGDLEYFRFTTDLYTHLGRSRRAMLDAARAYRDAVSRQNNSRPETRAKLSKAIELIENTRKSLSDLSHRYRDLWLRENRNYSLDIVLNRFNDGVSALADVEGRVSAAMKDFDRGQSLPPAADVRLAIEELTGRYFREWLMCGPFPMPSKEAQSDSPPDFLASAGGELAARPGVTEELEYDGNTYRWGRMASPMLAEVNLASQFPENSQNVPIYAYSTIESPKFGLVPATLGSAGAVQVFLNGRLVHQNHVKRDLQLDEDKIQLPLVEGRNHLMLKIIQNLETGGWGFSFRLPDNTVRSRKNRYYIK